MIVLFDIDGTLVVDEGLDGELYRAAVRDVLGASVVIHEDWARYAHVSDDGVLREIAIQEGVPFEDCVHEVRASFERLVERESASWRAVPGAVELFSFLSRHDDVQLGIATGGWKTTARKKLECAGFELGQVPLAASDDSIERVEIMRTSLKRVREAQSTASPADHRIVYVGDGPWDKAATAQLEWEFLAVGERLRGLHPLWIPDFSDPGILEAWPSALLPTTPAPS